MNQANQMAMNQQSLANMQGAMFGQGLAGIGQLGAAQQAYPMGSGGDGGGFGRQGTIYVSTIKQMELDVAEWLLDWDQ